MLCTSQMPLVHVSFCSSVDIVTLITSNDYVSVLQFIGDILELLKYSHRLLSTLGFYFQ